MATQGAGAVAVTGGTINGTAFGATTAASVRATTLQTTSTAGIGVPSGTTAALNVGGTITSTGTTNYGVLVNNTITSNATSEARVFAAVTNTQAASWTCTTVIGYDAFGVVTLGAGSAITNHYGFRGRATIANAGVTNAYGISLELAAAAGSWNLHASGTAPNYLAGDLRIGTTSQSGSALLTVNGAASFAGPIQLPSYTVATVPAASANARSKIWVSNAAAGAREYVSNGTNWVQSADATTVLS
ncbi:hypothetical protein [Chitinimonas koreensis]|nr:hypothetical protein [Chitinimonas koreensis]QNM94889.1 hypothetical protein H9L41_13255 [Chitinimonas koreensis]